MYSSQRFVISLGSHKIRPLDDRMPLDTGRGPLLAILRIFLHISLMLMSLNLSIYWHFSSKHCSLAHLHCFWISLSILLYFSWSDLNCLLLCKRLLISSVTQCGCLIFFDSFVITLFAAVIILVFRFVHCIWEFS